MAEIDDDNPKLALIAAAKMAWEHAASSHMECLYGSAALTLMGPAPEPPP